jgi:hypothetical protein
MCVALGLTMFVIAEPAHADHAAAPPPADADDTRRSGGPLYDDLAVRDTAEQRVVSISLRRRAAAIGLALVPGFFIHGIGAWTVGEKRTAKKIASGEAIGLTVAALSGLLVGGSGGNPYTTPAIPLVVGGAGLFFQSWFTDIYVAAGGDAIVERPRAIAPWSVELGTSWLHDAYRERALLRAGGRIELPRLGSLDFERIELGAFAMVDAGGDALIGQGDVRVRLLGEHASGEQIDDGSRLSVRVGSRWHRDDGDRVTQWTQELAIDGRLDLDRIDRLFRRSFVELGTGIGIVRVKYGDEVAREWSSELLGRFAWGTYLGSRGEAMLFYEHTRDGLVGGIPAWRASGFIGSVGAAIDVRVHGPWALRGALEIGNAYLTTFAVAYRGGPQ